MVAPNWRRDVMTAGEMVEQQQQTVASYVAELAGGEHLGRVPIIGELAASRLPVWIVVRAKRDGVDVELVVVATKLTDRYVVVRQMAWGPLCPDGGAGRVRLGEGMVVPLLEVERMATAADLAVMELKFGREVVRCVAGGVGKGPNG
jgi:hypothetical protein